MTDHDTPFHFYSRRPSSMTAAGAYTEPLPIFVTPAVILWLLVVSFGGPMAAVPLLGEFAHTDLGWYVLLFVLFVIGCGPLGVLFEWWRFVRVEVGSQGLLVNGEAWPWEGIEEIESGKIDILNDEGRPHSKQVGLVFHFTDHRRVALFPEDPMVVLELHEKLSKRLPRR